MGRVQELAAIEIESGVSLFDGKPFCHIHAKSHNGVQLGGQMTPDEVRGLAMNWLAAAETAESDAAVVAELRKIGFEDKVIGPFIVGLRQRRT